MQFLIIKRTLAKEEKKKSTHVPHAPKLICLSYPYAKQLAQKTRYKLKQIYQQQHNLFSIR